MPAELRLAVDIDVVLDVLANRAPHVEQSARVWAAVEGGGVKGLLAAHSLPTIHYLVSRHLDRRTAARAVHDLLEVFSVATVDASVLQEALCYGWPDFEDAVQMAAAVAAGATHLITRNTPDYRSAPIPVLTPAEAMPLLFS